MDGFDTVISAAKKIDPAFSPENTGIGSLVYANKPGDGSAREQAASCQKVLGGWANIAHEYSTKRYRSNLINWGMLPLTIEGEPPFEIDDYILLKNVKEEIKNNSCKVTAYVIKPDGSTNEIVLGFAPLTEDERGIILAGCLINFYKNN